MDLIIFRHRDFDDARCDAENTAHDENLYL